jgi:hypothetical protein
MPRHALLEKMLDRVYVALTSGPALSCRPHQSRQRIDLAQLALLDTGGTQRLLQGLLTDGTVKVVHVPPRAVAEPGADEAQRARAKQAAADALAAQQAVLSRLRTLADDARSFEQETGAQVLSIGFPLLQLPARRGPRGETKRLLAPIAFIPVQLVLKAGATPSVVLEALGEAADRVVPNPALQAWIAQQTGARPAPQPADEADGPPWDELLKLARRVAADLELPAPTLDPQAALEAVARSDDDAAQGARILPGAVLGLFPLGNQNLVDDLEAMADGDALAGPVEAFLQVKLGLGAPAALHETQATGAGTHDRLVTDADPCQARAVRLARASRGLVVHGPPGTGKSQTIANVIGDHLARGERVLFVCDKRTALDVVLHRLERLGLSELCAIVHDARKDQRDLYMGLRGQLDNLAEAKSDARADKQLQKIDAELAALHGDLSGYLSRVQAPVGDGPALAELVGEWVALAMPRAFVDVPLACPGLRPEHLAGRAHALEELFTRAEQTALMRNPWRGTLGMQLQGFLAKGLPEWSSAVGRVSGAATALDATRHDGLVAFKPGPDLAEQGAARAQLAEGVAALFASAAPGQLMAWAQASAEQVETARAQLVAMQPAIELFRKAPLDAELAITAQATPQTLPGVTQAIEALTQYLAIATHLFGFLYFARNTQATEVLRPYGLGLSAANAERVKTFLEGLRVRLLLHSLVAQLPGPPTLPTAEAELRRVLEDHAATLAVIATLEQDTRLHPVAAQVRAAFASPPQQAALVEGLRAGGPRGRALAGFQQALLLLELLAPAAQAEQVAAACAGEPMAPLWARLTAAQPTLENLLRLEDGLLALPAPLQAPLRACLERDRPMAECLAALRRTALEAAVQDRLAQDPTLQGVDGERLRTGFERYQHLQQQRTGATRAAVQHLWQEKQKARLLAATGSRLNGEGAELKRRLLVRGERALKVRQVIAQGAAVQGGDPLFDLRPVWMASPATVAQIFPRAALFDVVIFDEASQCRLEEALPVLTRAKRVVIAGDPRQLPPTRFFESAVAQSQDSEAETDQERFVEQQGEAEDLLTAALQLEIEQCFLDVHYRSANADLIAFSNEHFYDSRLQPIPGHPRHQAERAPVRLVAVNGTYDKRVNPAEALAVVERVKALLAQKEPPSIGVACFNLGQRDLIADELDKAALADPAFSARLAQARERTGAGSFEGLFVKNLENVQGDERDVMLVSTTYGPDPKGRFYRRFGPLGQAGGGRRLNVLVTRARQEVQLFTSIPPEVYRSLPALAPGQAPNGVWLLFSYLGFAERLEKVYAERDLRGAEGRTAGEVVRRASSAPSPLGDGVATALARGAGLGSEVPWGNEGFRVDVAVQDARVPGAVTVGLLCDGTRYPKAPDALEWDLFRTRVLEGQGWALLRLWSPHVFRDLEGTLAKLAASSAQVAADAAAARRAEAQRTEEGSGTLH